MTVAPPAPAPAMNASEEAEVDSLLGTGAGGAPPAPSSAGKPLTVRQYLDSTVVPVLRLGLRQLVKTRPDDPYDFLVRSPSGPSMLSGLRADDWGDIAHRMMPDAPRGSTARRPETGPSPAQAIPRPGPGWVSEIKALFYTTRQVQGVSVVADAAVSYHRRDCDVDSPRIRLGVVQVMPRRDMPVQLVGHIYPLHQVEPVNLPDSSTNHPGNLAS